MTIGIRSSRLRARCVARTARPDRDEPVAGPQLVEQRAEDLVASPVSSARRQAQLARRARHDRELEHQEAARSAVSTTRLGVEGRGVVPAAVVAVLVVGQRVPGARRWSSQNASTRPACEISLELAPLERASGSRRAAGRSAQPWMGGLT